MNWTTKKGGLMAICYVQADSTTEMARLTPAQIGARSQSIVDALMRNGQQRDPTMRLVTWRAAQQDNHPVVYMERDLRVQTLAEEFAARVYTIATAWRGNEISIECA